MTDLRRDPAIRRALILSVVFVVFWCAYVVWAWGWPWSGWSFDPAVDGSPMQWIANLLTGLGLLGIWYQFHALRTTRSDQILVEINSLVSAIEHERWTREGRIVGTLYRVGLEHHGSAKAMRVDVKLEPADLFNSAWRVATPKQTVIAPGDVANDMYWIFHVPDTDREAVLSGRQMPQVRVEWTDPRGDRLVMIDNDIATIVVETE